MTARKTALTKSTALEELYVEQLRELYSAETQILNAMAEMTQLAHDPNLKAHLGHHLDQTYVHVERIEKILKDLDQTPEGHPCAAMLGLIQDGKKMIRNEEAATAKDAALIELAKRIERYEIASYGCLLIYASLVGDKKVADTLQMTMNEEAEMDRKLTGSFELLKVEYRNGTAFSSRSLSTGKEARRDGVVL